MDTIPGSDPMEKPPHLPLGGLDPADLLRQGAADDTFMDGVTSNFNPPPIEELAAIFPQICDALQFAHDQGIVNRDIKPESILRDRLGRVKVADFGIAKIVGDVTQAFLPDLHALVASMLTEAGKIIGTPAYMVP
jgi:serine/threonine protein kinase